MNMGSCSSRPSDRAGFSGATNEIRRCANAIKAALTLLLIGIASCGLAFDRLPGMNRPALAWIQDEREAFAILDAMASQGVPSVRIMLVPPLDRVTRLIERSNALGIKVLLMVPLTLPEYYPPGTRTRGGRAHIYNVPPLSSLDVDRFSERWRGALALFDSRSLKIHAFQIDNEFNSSVFNGDFPLLDEGVVVERGSEGGSVFWKQYLNGMRKIVAAASVVSKIVRGHEAYRAVPILLGGLARPESRWVKSVGVVLVEPDLALRTLRDMGIDDYIDAYALHIYPGAPPLGSASSEDHMTRYIDERMSQVVSVARPDKPWWITEWGFAIQEEKFQGCVKGDARRPLFEAFSVALAGSRWARLVRESYIYDWEESARFRVWNDGQVLCSSYREVFR